MREWARTDDAAAASVRAADQRVLAAVRQAFLDYGFDGEDADLRANATFAAGIGFLHLRGPQPSARVPPEAANASSTSCSSADALGRRLSILKGMVRSPAMPAVSAAASHDQLRSSSPDWPSARRRPSGCAGCPPPQSTTFVASGFTELLVPARYGGMQAAFPAILDPVRRMAHGCASSAWTLGFYALHNWMLALFDEHAQEEAFATRPFLAPAPLAPTGRGVPVGGGIRLTGRWSWATGVMHGNWIIVGALCGPDDAHLPRAGAAARRRRPDRGRLAHRRHAGHRLQRRRHHRRVRPRAPAGAGRPTSTRARRPAPGCTTPTPTAGRWCPPWPCWRRCPRSAAPNASPTSTPNDCRSACWRTRASCRRTSPSRRPTSAEARVRLRALRGLLADTVGEIETIVAAGDPVPRPVRGEARLAAAHIVHESRAVIGDLLEASGASAHFLDNPLQRIKRDVDVICRPRGVRLRHQPRTRRRAHTGYEGPADRNGVRHESTPWPTTYVTASPTSFRSGSPTR